jgi:hypothetical protein
VIALKPGVVMLGERPQGIRKTLFGELFCLAEGVSELNMPLLRMPAMATGACFDGPMMK